MLRGSASQTAAAVREPFSTASAVILPTVIRIFRSAIRTECSPCARAAATRSASSPDLTTPVGGQARLEGGPVRDPPDAVGLDGGGRAAGGRGRRVPRVGLLVVGDEQP